MNLRLNIGCGKTPTKGYVNIDNSLSIKLANSWFFYRVMKFLKLLKPQQIENIEWNKKHDIKFSDVTKKIPINDNAAECIYTSHMVEHLSRHGVKIFLKEAHRVLNENGVIRIAVPDLALHINNYLTEKDADKFMRGLFVEAPPIAKFIERLKLIFIGYRHHQWMYDGKSLCLLLEDAGFKDVVVCNPGETLIKNPGDLNLYERSNESVIVEGKK